MLYDRILKNNEIIDMLNEYRTLNVKLKKDYEKIIKDKENGVNPSRNNIEYIKISCSERKFFEDNYSYENHLTDIFMHMDLVPNNQTQAITSRVNYFEKSPEDFSNLEELIDYISIKDFKSYIKTLIDVEKFTASQTISGYNLQYILPSQYYKNEQFINVLQILPIPQVKQFLNQIKNSSKYNMSAVNIIKTYQTHHKTYYNNFIKELEEFNEKISGTYYPEYTIKAMDLLLYEAWRHHKPDGAAMEFNKIFKKKGQQNPSIEQFNFWAEDFYEIFEEFRTRDDLYLGDFFLIFLEMYEKYSDVIVEKNNQFNYNHQMDKISLQEFKEVHNPSTPIKWTLELMGEELK